MIEDTPIHSLPMRPKPNDLAQGNQILASLAQIQRQLVDMTARFDRLEARMYNTEAIIQNDRVYDSTQPLTPLHAIHPQPWFGCLT